MVRDGILYGASLLVVAAIVWHFTNYEGLTAIPLVLALFFMWFFRDPSRRVPMAPGLIVSPADGRVEEAEWVETAAGGRLRVTIFLNVFDVHVSRSPVAGVVEVVEFREGQFLNAMRPESAIHNEQTLVTINAGHYHVSFKQIAGLLARRIVCNLKVGDKVERGQRIGLIKFGSRMDVLMPAEVKVYAKVGQKVKGGVSILAAMPIRDEELASLGGRA